MAKNIHREDYGHGLNLAISHVLQMEIWSNILILYVAVLQEKRLYVIFKAYLTITCQIYDN